jgi:hypothetical protein
VNSASGKIVDERVVEDEPTNKEWEVWSVNGPDNSRELLILETW